MNRIMCSVPTSECYLNECTACPGTSALKDFITSVLADQCISRVEFQTCQQTDRSLAMLSDSLTHDTIAVYEFQKIITHYLKEDFQPRKMIYFTDGAAQHFTNKYNFINLLHHEMDFGIPAEWHFYVTAHGKGRCDGIGGN